MLYDLQRNKTKRTSTFMYFKKLSNFSICEKPFQLQIMQQHLESISNDVVKKIAYQILIVVNHFLNRQLNVPAEAHLIYNIYLNVTGR